MAETWRVSRPKLIAATVIDALGSPFKRILSPSPGDIDIRRILVLEPWHIGDVVLATAALSALRYAFPKALITLLGKPHAEELLRHSDLVDDVIVFDLPWTAKSSKYDPRRYNLAALRTLISELRGRKFDLTVDARMDLRSNVLTFLTRAPRRIGYRFGGGSFLLTDAVRAEPKLHHRVDDWLAVVAPVTKNREQIRPSLRVTESERALAADKLRAAGIAPADLVIGVHAGASDERRQWPMENFARVASDLARSFGAKVVLFREPGPQVPCGFEPDAIFHTTLRELMSLLTHCDVFLCNDSGPMHIADALEVPVVAVFLTGNPTWHRPFRESQRVVGAGTGHDLRVAPSETEVLEAAIDLLTTKVAARALAEAPPAPR